MIRFLLAVTFIIINLTCVFTEIRIDKFTNEYIASEKILWKKIDTQLILIDRGSLLNQIYHEHYRILQNDFGVNNALESLGLQKYQPLINTMLAIDTNIRNIKDYLVRNDYGQLGDLAQNAADQMQRSANDFHNTIGQISFWNDLIVGVIKFIFYSKKSTHFFSTKKNLPFITFYFVVYFFLRTKRLEKVNRVKLVMSEIPMNYCSIFIKNCQPVH